MDINNFYYVRRMLGLYSSRPAHDPLLKSHLKKWISSFIFNIKIIKENSVFQKMAINADKRAHFDKFLSLLKRHG